ncbi:calcineurin-like phosphoesterase family protein [uncultured Alistipes sp.]|jgi:Predicted phosphohydrolases|uniref:calcineurin-like phosphoesterase family protein n=1 Tax=uncultured Alistipes sp. TaxID=538949 RepID=UPI0025F7D69A|nr:calcineurin-like phosphoesterase family protein [uncultured Alistipes sp.]
MIKYIKYLLIVLLAAGFISCTEREGAQIRNDYYEKVDITPDPGMNLVGRVSDGKNPIEGVVVSDGITVTTTDAQGIYQMRVKRTAKFVFVSVPAEYEIPVVNGIPTIYKKISIGEEDVVQRSFTLEYTGKKEKFTLWAIADVQFGQQEDIDQFDRFVAAEMRAFAQNDLQGPVYGISLGDLVWDQLQYLTPIYGKRIREFGIPMFQVIGNHDHDTTISTDALSSHAFEKAFGPTYYSSNIGDCHLVVLDDVYYKGGKTYEGTISQEQLDWLKQDLQYVPKDKLILLGVHIPTQRRNSGTAVTNRAELYKLLEGYTVRIMSGHTHNNYTATISPTIEENTLGAVCGAFWTGPYDPAKDPFGTGPLCNEGSPAGYAVYEIEGNQIKNFYYKGIQTSREFQMYLYPVGSAFTASRQDGLIFNIFNWHTTWTVEVQEDANAWKTLTTNVKEVDRRSYDYLKGIYHPDDLYRQTDPENNNDHMFYYKPTSDSWQKVTVRATDPYGNVYTDSIQNN